jgi:hypothetical protein
MDRIERITEMASGNYCPTSLERIDARTARLSAFIVVSMIIIYLLTGNAWIMIALAFDFGIRSFVSISTSIIGQASGLILRALQIKPVWTDAAPKLFAAKLGFGFSLAISIAAFAGAPMPAIVLASALLLCAGMEALIGFCVGCQMYALLLRLKIKNAR